MYGVVGHVVHDLDDLTVERRGVGAPNKARRTGVR
jgi:hypothetical protein